MELTKTFSLRIKTVQVSTWIHWINNRGPIIRKSFFKSTNHSSLMAKSPGIISLTATVCIAYHISSNKRLPFRWSHRTWMSVQYGFLKSVRQSLLLLINVHFEHCFTLFVAFEVLLKISKLSTVSRPILLQNYCGAFCEQWLFMHLITGLCPCSYCCSYELKLVPTWF